MSKNNPNTDEILDAIKNMMTDDMSQIEQDLPKDVIELTNPVDEGVKSESQKLDILELSNPIVDETNTNINDNKTVNEIFSFNGYENIIGGVGNDQIIHLNSNDLQIGYGIVGGEGQDIIIASSMDIIRYDLEEKYRSNFARW